MAGRDVAVRYGCGSGMQGHATGHPDSPVLARDEKVHCVWQDVGESMQHERALVRDDGPLHPDGEPCGAYLIVFACWVVAETVEPLSHSLEAARVGVVGEKLCADASFLGLSCREEAILGVGEAVECWEIGLLVYVRHFYSITLVYADKHVVLLIASRRSA